MMGRVAAGRTSRLLPPRANIFEEINEEAKGSWISRFLPDGDRKDPGARDLISEQPVLFTKVGALCPRHSRPAPHPAPPRMTGLHTRRQMDAIGEPIFDYERWETHRSNDRYAAIAPWLLPHSSLPLLAP